MQEDNFIDYYALLGLDYSRFLNITISPESDLEREINSAYRKLALKNHPDRGGDPKKFAEISNAKDVLLDRKQKKNYDELYQRFNELGRELTFFRAFGEFKVKNETAKSLGKDHIDIDQLFEKLKQPENRTPFKDCGPRYELEEIRTKLGFNMNEPRKILKESISLIRELVNQRLDYSSRVSLTLFLRGFGSNTEFRELFCERFSNLGSNDDKLGFFRRSYEELFFDVMSFPKEILQKKINIAFFNDEDGFDFQKANNNYQDHKYASLAIDLINSDDTKLFDIKRKFMLDLSKAVRDKRDIASFVSDFTKKHNLEEKISQSNENEVSDNKLKQADIEEVVQIINFAFTGHRVIPVEYYHKFPVNMKHMNVVEALLDDKVGSNKKFEFVEAIRAEVGGFPCSNETIQNKRHSIQTKTKEHELGMENNFARQ